MEPAALRAQFPVLERVGYLNAGTDGPVPASAARAAAERTRTELERGRSGREHHEARLGLWNAVRSSLVELMGCSAGELAITHSTTDGVNTVLSALSLSPGDELLTTDEEHPGVLAPLAVAARRSGATVRMAPFAEVAERVRSETVLVACSHVSWVTGRVVDTEGLAATGPTVLLDGAQALGAVPVDVHALGCDFYAASGQKWLCGPDGAGCLYVAPRFASRLTPPWPGYESLADPSRAAELALHPDARRFDRGSGAAPLAAWWLASLELLAEAGWDAVHERAARLAEGLAADLRGRGVEVAPRGRSTLVSWHDPEPDAAVLGLAEAGFLVRDIPGRGLVRASIGAWSSEEELAELARLAA